MRFKEMIKADSIPRGAIVYGLINYYGREAITSLTSILYKLEVEQMTFKSFLSTITTEFNICVYILKENNKCGFLLSGTKDDIVTGDYEYVSRNNLHFLSVLDEMEVKEVYIKYGKIDIYIDFPEIKGV